MRLAWIVCFAMFGVSGAMSCEATGAVVRAGIYTGNDLNEMPDSVLTPYIAGYANGLLVSPLLEASQSCNEQMWACLQGRTNSQLAAIVRKYLSENPELWHVPANLVAFNAIVAPCQASSRQ